MSLKKKLLARVVGWRKPAVPESNTQEPETPEAKAPEPETPNAKAAEKAATSRRRLGWRHGRCPSSATTRSAACCGGRCRVGWPISAERWQAIPGWPTSCGACWRTCFPKPATSSRGAPDGSAVGRYRAAGAHRVGRRRTHPDRVSRRPGMSVVTGAIAHLDPRCIVPLTSGESLLFG